MVFVVNYFSQSMTSLSYVKHDFYGPILHWKIANIQSDN